MTRWGAIQASRARVRVLAGLVLSLFGIAALRAAYLQTLGAPSLRCRTEDQRVRRLKLLPARGTMYDRNMRELAVSIPGASVFVDPSVVLQSAERFDQLCRSLAVDPQDARRQLTRGGSHFAWLKRRISPAEEETVHALKIQGVGIAREAHRFYPNKSLAGQALGFVGSEEEGRGGLEYQYDAVLRGRDVWVRADRDARGGLLLTDAPEPTEGMGQSLVLTIDETIQHIAEEELAKAVEKAAAKGGWVVALEPSTGEILALAQWPTFNPNAMKSAPAATRKLRATCDVYEPGSTFKSLFVGILLDRKIVRPTDTVFCENGLWVTGSQRIHDHHGQGLLTVSDVLKVSSNIGVAKLSERIAPQGFYDGLKLFGVGVPTEVDLPGESKGILLPTESWSKSTAKTMSFGQGVSATALQVTSALATIANGGVRMKPHIVRSVLDQKGAVVKRIAPQVAVRAISPEAARELARMMESVVHAEGGTGSLAAVPGFTTAGKTGTAWKPNPDGRGYARNAIVASFMGFVPSRAPRLALLVAIDEPTRGSRYGGTTAGPAFREIAQQALAYLQVPPEADAPAVAKAPGSGTTKTTPPPEEEVMPVAAAEETPRGTMPDLRGLTMREALRRIEGAGVAVNLTLVGSGIAAQQEPAPGLPLEEGSACRIVFNPLM